MNYLAIDYGRVHIGIALATGPISEPLISIPNSQAIKTIEALIVEHQIETIIVGLPQGRLESEVTTFAKDLEKKTNLPVVLHDETLTSQTASVLVRHRSRSKRQGADHHFAAALILEDYLESIENKPEFSSL